MICTRFSLNSRNRSASGALPHNLHRSSASGPSKRTSVPQTPFICPPPCRISKYATGEATTLARVFLTNVALHKYFSAITNCNSLPYHALWYLYRHGWFYDTRPRDERLPDVNARGGREHNLFLSSGALRDHAQVLGCQARAETDLWIPQKLLRWLPSVDGRPYPALNDPFLPPIAACFCIVNEHFYCAIREQQKLKVHAQR